MKQMNGRRKPLTPAETSKIEADGTTWVDNGVKTSTDKRLVYLRAMFFHAFKKGPVKINKNDIPYFPILGTKVDNVKQNKFSDADFQNILAKLPTYLHPLVKFLHKTGMRSGQAKAITWEMIDSDDVLRMPGFLTKNGSPYTLALTDKDGDAFTGCEYLVTFPKKNRLHGEAVFNVDALREEWRKACHELKLGVYDEKTRSYRGAQLHDFRRTAASNIIKKGKATSAAMMITGHKTASMFNRYDIKELDAQREAMGD